MFVEPIPINALFSFYPNALLCCIFGVDAFVLLSTKEATEKMSAGAICYEFALSTIVLTMTDRSGDKSIAAPILNGCISEPDIFLNIVFVGTINPIISSFLYMKRIWLAHSINAPETANMADSFGLMTNKITPTIKTIAGTLFFIGLLITPCSSGRSGGACFCGSVAFSHEKQAPKRRSCWLTWL
ncbi:hypothetical protein [Teredinibacter turnerae]|uniref:hypothetical protein n=1 Tax=Teredinibacter turnerae TaxID=2426 RepID=UPI0018DEDB71|nr:hypothetical protein [Teredinibacter turnerae]